MISSISLQKKMERMSRTNLTNLKQKWLKNRWKISNPLLVAAKSDKELRRRSQRKKKRIYSQSLIKAFNFKQNGK